MQKKITKNSLQFHFCIYVCLYVGICMYVCMCLSVRVCAVCCKNIQFMYMYVGVSLCKCDMYVFFIFSFKLEIMRAAGSLDSHMG